MPAVSSQASSPACNASLPPVGSARAWTGISSSLSQWSRPTSRRRTRVSAILCESTLNFIDAIDVGAAFPSALAHSAGLFPDLPYLFFASRDCLLAGSAGPLQFCGEPCRTRVCAAPAAGSVKLPTASAARIKRVIRRLFCVSASWANLPVYCFVSAGTHARKEHGHHPSPLRRRTFEHNVLFLASAWILPCGSRPPKSPPCLPRKRRRPREACGRRQSFAGSISADTTPFFVLHSHLLGRTGSQVFDVEFRIRGPGGVPRPVGAGQAALVGNRWVRSSTVGGRVLHLFVA